MFKKTTIFFSLLLGIVFLSNSVTAAELSQTKPYSKSFSTVNKMFVPFSSVEKKPINKPVIILACERSYEASTGGVIDSHFPMYLYRHAILDGKLTCEYEGYPPGDEQSHNDTKYIPTPEGTTCSAIPDFKFSCENKQADTCPTSCKRK